MKDNKLTAQNLMIGDWVEFHQSDGQCFYAQVEALNNDGTFSERGFFDDNEVSPIPLTAEILEKNGWEREGGVSKWHSDEHIVTILHWNADHKEVQIYTRGSRRLYDTMLDINYVHELQHALRLCGIEKEITL